jgi:uncharacterized protein YigA (DUF484 family)
MTSQQAEETSNPAVAEDEVSAYLEAHPDFFERHSDLLAALRVSHASGGAVSLIEHQVAVLRGQLQTERRRLAQLITRAQDFQSLSGRLHSLSLQLIAAPDEEHVRAVLRKSLCRELNADAVSLKLFPVERDAAAFEPEVAVFLELLDRGRSLCGPLDAERNGVLFRAEGEAIRSVALVPVRTDDRLGVLAIGSSDPERFGADMGTEVLDRLGEILGQKLQVLSRVND